MAKTLTCTTGPLAGYEVLPVALPRLTGFLGRCEANKVKYGFGCKDPDCGSGLVDFHLIDCSGWVRTALMYACSGAARDIPDGSFIQRNWFAGLGLKESEAADCQLSDNILRVCIHVADPLDETGHIWLVRNARTMESYGGNGPGSRWWNAPLESGHTLNELADAVYCLAELP